MANSNRLGELLVREKLISLAQLRTAQEEQQRAGTNLGYTLAKLGYISDTEITNFLSQQYRVPTVNLEEYEIDADILKLVSKDQCEKHRVIPVSRAGSSLIVAMADPTNLNAIDDLKFLTGYNIEPVIASETAIATAVDKFYNAGPSYDEVMAGFDEEEIDFTGDEEDINVLELEKQSSRRAGRTPGEHDPAQRHQEGRERHPHRAVREEAPRPLPRRRRAPRGDDAAAQAEGRHRQPREDHEQPGHRRAALAQDGRIKLKMGKGREMDFRVSRACRRCGARRSSCGSSTRGTCSST